jgi:zinc protease
VRGKVPFAEIDKVRTQLLTSALLARQTPQGQAEAIGRAVLLYGDAREADTRIARLQAVRVADIQRVLDQWVLRARRVTVDYVQGASA